MKFFLVLFLAIEWLIMDNFPLLTFYRNGKSRDDVGIMQRIDILASKDDKGIADFVCGEKCQQ